MATTSGTVTTECIFWEPARSPARVARPSRAGRGGSVSKPSPARSSRSRSGRFTSSQQENRARRFPAVSPTHAQIPARGEAWSDAAGSPPYSLPCTNAEAAARAWQDRVPPTAPAGALLLSPGRSSSATQATSVAMREDRNSCSSPKGAMPEPACVAWVVGRPATQLRLLRCPFCGIPLLAGLVGPRANLDANPVGIKGKECVIALHVVLCFGRVVNPSTHAHATLVCVVYLAAVLNGEGEVLDSDVVVAVRATICASKPEPGLGLGAHDMVLPETQIADVLRPAIGLEPGFDLEAHGPEQTEIEGEGRLDVRNRKVNVVHSSYGHPGLLIRFCLIGGSLSSVPKCRDAEVHAFHAHQQHAFGSVVGGARFERATSCFVHAR